MKLSLFNTLTRKREVFSPIDNKLIKMYVCGPTVYDHPHIGNARSAAVYDVLYRILKLIYGDDRVLYVRNITDVDDKIITRALERKIPISELTKETTEYFHKDMAYLGCLKPNIEPKATDHINEMISIIQKLIELGFAYERSGNVYFDVTKSAHYTDLSGRSLDEMFEGLRIRNSEDKINSGDFVLWKSVKNQEMDSSVFESPFGQGRPGWHIECSAMSHKYLGETFDIHGGGADLIFPHHTNEIAQSTSAFPGSEFAKYWVHNGFLTVNHEKMSKSLGNFVTVNDLRSQGIKGDTARLVLLGTNYRSPLDYNGKAISDSEKTISYWYRAIESTPPDELRGDLPLPEEFVNTLLDDINTHMAITLINNYAKEAHQSKLLAAKIAKGNLVYSCAKFLGLMSLALSEWFDNTDETGAIEELLKKRKIAKESKDWQTADNIRNELENMNIVLEDKPDGGTSWRKLK
jgi:cysteinyl-tRNA synthetase